jgi:hypothetical protein
MSRLNLMRHGTLEEATAQMDGDEPLSEAELRALVFNLADKLLQEQKRDRIPVLRPLREKT